MNETLEELRRQAKENPCKNCEGLGYYFEQGRRTCTICEGTGIEGHEPLIVTMNKKCKELEDIVHEVASFSCHCQMCAPDVDENKHYPSCIVGKAQRYFGKKVTEKQLYEGTKKKCTRIQIKNSSDCHAWNNGKCMNAFTCGVINNDCKT